MAASGFSGKKHIYGAMDAQRTHARRALVHAASVISTRDRRKGTKEVHVVDMRPLALHLLDGLARAGFESAVVAVGENASQIVDAIQAAKVTIKVDYIFVPPHLWRTLANSIICARIAFPADEPFLIIRADQLYDWQLLHRVRVQAKFEDGIEAFALIDTEPATLHWASGAHCTASCKSSPAGCNALVKVQRDVAAGRITACGHRLKKYDAVTAGDVYVARPSLFWLLHDSSRDEMYRNTSEVMGHLATCGALGYVDVGEQTCSWFGSRTLTAVFRAKNWTDSSDLRTQGNGLQSGKEGFKYQHIMRKARDLMLRNSDDDAPSPFRRAWPVERPMLLPLLRLGARLGQGSYCEVVEASLVTTPMADGAHAASPSRFVGMGWPAKFEKERLKFEKVGSRLSAYADQDHQSSSPPSSPSMLSPSSPPTTHTRRVDSSTAGDAVNGEARGEARGEVNGEAVCQPSEAECQTIVGEEGDSSDTGSGAHGVPPLAVKLYETGHSADRGAGAVMRDVMWEVHVLRQIAHAHIVRLCDSIEFTDACYVVMVRYDGPDLHEHIHAQPRGALCEADARRLFGHLLDAVRHAHSRGFLHCDLKPANVRLNAACDTAVVVDWGMARAITQQPEENICCGSPLYASPEQLTGQNPEQAWGRAVLSPAADVWSLGATLHEMLAGTPPFGGGSMEELVANVMQVRAQNSLRRPRAPAPTLDLAWPSPTRPCSDLA